MNKTNLLDQLLIQNKGYIKTSEVVENNISRSYFGEYVKKNNLTKVTQGLYMSSDTWQDDLYVLQTRYPDVIFSHETASFLLGLSSREPFEVSITLESKKGSARLNNESICVYKIKKELFEVGMMEGQTPVGNKVRHYNSERTLCDLVRSRNKIENQEVQTAVKTYLRSKVKDIPKLMRYAKLFKVTKFIKQYTEVLLND